MKWIFIGGTGFQVFSPYLSIEREEKRERCTGWTGLSWKVHKCAPAYAHTKKYLGTRGTNGIFSVFAGEAPKRLVSHCHNRCHMHSSRITDERHIGPVIKGFGGVYSSRQTYRRLKHRRYVAFYRHDFDRPRATVRVTTISWPAHQRLAERKNPPRSRGSSGDSGRGATRSVTQPGPEPTSAGEVVVLLVAELPVGAQSTSDRRDDDDDNDDEQYRD